MSQPLPSDVWRLGDAITPMQKYVLLALVDYGRKIHPSQATLALKTGLSQRAVGQAVAELRKKGLVETTRRGSKALSYSVVLKAPQSAPRADHDQHHVPIRSAPGAGSIGTTCRGILTSQRTSPLNQPPGTPARGGGDHPFDGVDPEAERRIRRWAPGDTEHLATCQRRVVTRVLGELGVAPGDWRRWWGSLCDRWGDSGVPPYQVLKAELDGIGPDVRDRVAVLAFRLKIGRVAA